MLSEAGALPHARPQNTHFAAPNTQEHDALFERESSLGGLDDDGLPTLDAQGEPLSKSARKKLVKQRDKHANAHAAATAQ